MDKQQLQPIAIRKARLADGGKVRYRVYSTPSEFVVVIADSALMAVKLSGVAAPHKIVRDLATEVGTLEAQRLAPPEESPEKVNLTTEYTPKADIQLTDLPEPSPNEEQGPFVPLHLADLQQQGVRSSHILPPEIAHEVVEEVAVAEPPPAPAAPAQPAPEQAPTSAPAPSTEETLAKLADDLLPAAPPSDNAELSPEEVDKLLNG